MILKLTKLTSKLACSLIIISTPAFAFFCPNNFNQIELGNSLQQVQQQCGTADKETKKEVTDEGPQSWDYFVAQTVMLNDGKMSDGTLKTSIVFDDKGKAINISVNGIGVGSSTVCGDSIQLGDTRDNVKKICGEPVFINKQTGQSEKKHQVVELKYGESILIFQDGVLKEKK